MSNGASQDPAVPARVEPATLTPRELDVLRLMGEGLTTREIADQLHMRFKTAACHRNRILQKLAVKSTVSAVRWAIRQGVIPL
jgi:DNA-binding NarL/FixJ family response regulator